MKKSQASKSLAILLKRLSSEFMEDIKSLNKRIEALEKRIADLEKIMKRF